MATGRPGAGPDTHYGLFAGLRDAGVAWLLTGATALVLHGVPRLTHDLDLVVDPDRENLERLGQLMAAWGYGEVEAGPQPEGGVVRRFRHPQAALAEIDLVLPPPGEFARLAAGATAVTLVDVAIPLVGAADLRALKEGAGTEAGRADAAGLDLLAALRAGTTGDGGDVRAEQTRKFSRWSVAARLDWILASARLAKGMAPEARPLTRGLTRRHGWYGRR